MCAVLMLFGGSLWLSEDAREDPGLGTAIINWDLRVPKLLNLLAFSYIGNHV